MKLRAKVECTFGFRCIWCERYKGIKFVPFQVTGAIGYTIQDFIHVYARRKRVIRREDSFL